MAGNKTPESLDLPIDNARFSPHTSPPSLSLPHTPQDHSRSVLRLEVAAYISQMSAELSAMARNSEMPLLSYFLDMAAAEARATDDQLRHALKLGPDPDTAIAAAQARSDAHKSS